MEAERTRMEEDQKRKIIELKEQYERIELDIKRLRKEKTETFIKVKQSAEETHHFMMELEKLTGEATIVGLNLEAIKVEMTSIQTSTQ